MTIKEPTDPEGLGPVAWVTLIGMVGGVVGLMAFWDGKPPSSTEDLERWLNVVVSTGAIWAAVFARQAILQAIGHAIASAIRSSLGSIAARLDQLAEILKRWGASSEGQSPYFTDAMRVLDSARSDLKSTTIGTAVAPVKRPREREKSAASPPGSPNATVVGRTRRAMYALALFIGVGTIAAIIVRPWSYFEQHHAQPNREVETGEVVTPPVEAERWVRIDRNLWTTLRACGHADDMRAEILSVKAANNLVCPNLDPGSQVCIVGDVDAVLLPRDVPCKGRPTFPTRQAALGQTP